MSAITSHRANGLGTARGACAHHATRRRGVLLLNLGTPDRPDTPAVRRYLREFLGDPDVIKLPPRLKWLNKPLAAMIALFRASQSAEAYRSIWTDEGSPLAVITEEQARDLETTLPRGWTVFWAMRYGNPSVASTLREIAATGIEELVVIPMYPQFSGPTTGTALDDLYQHLRTLGRELHLTVRNAWFDDVGYVDAQARLIHQFAEANELDPENCRLVFSAHSMPESYIRAGDPYQDQILESVDLILERLGWPRDRMEVAYQSKLGPVPWLSPSTEQALLDLGEDGEQNVLVCPISFTADCLETLEEIGMRYREEFEAFGGRMHLCPSLNTFEPFIKTLSRMVLRGTRSSADCRATAAPLFRPRLTPDEDVVAPLVMIGASLPARLGNGVPRKLAHVTPEQFRELKRPQQEVPDLLREIREREELDECWLWNTCTRFELYGWVGADNGMLARDRTVAKTLETLSGSNGERVEVNVLRGKEALHHLLRTAAGLNSMLPGDGEVVRQMEVAQELASRCESAGPRTERIRDEVQHCMLDLQQRTAWGRFQPEYCTVALKRVALDLDIDWTKARCVVIGGSVTAVSTVRTFREHLGVPAAHITVAYRNHRRGKLMKRLRAAVGEGLRLQLDTYEDARLREAIADADVVVFAVDSRKPIVERGQLAAARNLPPRAMTIIDFNTFGSTGGVGDLERVRIIDSAALERAVTDFSDSLLECPAFAAATEEAEAKIRNHLARIAKGLHASEPTDHPCLGCTNGAHNELGEECPCPRQEAMATCPQRLMTERIAS